jgi:hypothetical protein
MTSISLHIGVPKTATSFIQSWLHVNRNALAARGVYAPERPIYAHRLAAEHVDAFPSSRMDVVDIKKIDLQRAVGAFEAAVRSGRYAHLIISSEYFYAASPEAVIGDLRVRFGLPIDLIVYIRSQDAVAVSGYNQDVKKLGKTALRPRPHYMASHDWRVLLDRWSQHVGRERMRVISYDLSAAQRTVLADFVAAACPVIADDVARGVFADSPVANDSLPADLLEFKRLANALGEFGAADFLEAMMQAGYKGERFGIGLEEIRHWRAIYKESNEYVAREYFSAANDEAIFPTASADNGVDYEGRLPPETVARVLAFMLKDQQTLNRAANERLEALEKQVAALSKATAIVSAVE